MTQGVIVCMTPEQMPDPHVPSAQVSCAGCATKVWIDIRNMEALMHGFVAYCTECARPMIEGQ